MACESEVAYLKRSVVLALTWGSGGLKAFSGGERAEMAEYGENRGFGRLSGSFSDSLFTKKSQRTAFVGEGTSSLGQRTASVRQKTASVGERTSFESQRAASFGERTASETQSLASGWPRAANCGRESSPSPLSLNQHGLVDFEVFFHGLYVGKRHGCPLGLVFDELVVHQMFAHQVNVEMRILHLPDLAGFQGLERDSAFLLHLYVRPSVPEQITEGNANRTGCREVFKSGQDEGL